MMLFPSLRNRGGFFSDYYLGTVFGRASGRRRSPVTREVDAAFRTLTRLHERAEQRAGDAATVRETFARPLLRDVFGYHLGEGEKGIHGLFSSAEDEASGKPLLLAYVGAFDEDLDARRNGNASATERLAAQLAKARVDLRYGLLVTGERIRLIRRKGEGPRGAYLELDIPGCLETEDRESLAAALRLFGASAFTPAEDGSLPIDAIERESREHAERVSEDLKRAVFQTAERLIQALLDARGETEDLTALRDAALTCLYRLLFILYAEARDPRLLQNPVYRDSYSLDSLVREVTGLDDPPGANRFGLWDRVIALFAIHRDGLPGMEGIDPIPARGGELFDAATPAGRILEEVRLDDRTVTELLLDLATTAPRRGVGKERISFRELDIEQLGAVYEGLLEYEPRVAERTTIEVRVQGRTYALAPGELVRLVREKDLQLKGPVELVAGTEAEVLHPAWATDEDLTEEPAEPIEGEGEETAPEPDEDTGLRKGAAATFLRRFEPGDFHFVPGPGRKGSGSFYTPLPLVQDLVRHALEPLVEGRSAPEIEGLRVLDPACGSAHFLVEAMRFLGQALHRAYVLEHGGKPPPGFRGEWDTNHEAPDEEARGSEARSWCKRRIAERCLFGVDLNPTAVQLAQVSLWIESLAGDRPLSYFAHHVRCGNSILGTWLERLGEPPLPTLRAKQARGGGRMSEIFAEPVKEAICKASDLRLLIDCAADAGAVEPDSLDEYRFKEHQRRQAGEVLAAARLLFDLRSASAFVPEIWAEWPQLCSLGDDAGRLRAYAEARPWWPLAAEVIERERFFHWELEFPEVFLDGNGGGFDVVLGNPPWDKIKPDRKEFYGRHDVLIRAFVGGELDRRIEELNATVPGLGQGFAAYQERVKATAAYLRKGGDYRYQDWEVDGKSTGGDPDAFKFFVERAHRLVRDGGRVGFVVPSAIYNNEGCTGLRHLLLGEAEIERFYAFENRKKIFPIHSSYKFVSLVFRKGEPSADGFRAAFMRHDLEELTDAGPKDWMVLVRRAELERLSPGTLAFLEYRSPRDREILLKMYGYDEEGNPVNPRPLLGDQGPGTWNARFYREFDMTNDRDLWTDPKTGKLYNPRQILGPVPGTTSAPPYYDPAAWPEIRERMAEKGFWPLYEGKHIEQFLVDIKPIERWVSLEAAERKYGKSPDPGPKLVFRAIARNTDERTFIAAVLPKRSCFGNSCWGAGLRKTDADRLCAILNSLPTDYAIRFRVSSNMNFTHVGKIAVLQPYSLASGAPILTRSASASAVPSMFDDSGKWSQLWHSERAVAEAYGLSPDEFKHILSTFPVLARKRPAFYAYLKQRIEDWKREVEGGKAYSVGLVAQSEAEYRAGGTGSRRRSAPEER
jgi:hypothetical protein